MNTRSIRLLLKPATVALFRQNGIKTCIAASNTKFLSPIRSSNTKVNFVSTFEAKSKQTDDSLVNKILYKIPFLNIKNMRIKATGYILYEEILEAFNYVQLIEKYNLPDTFYTWFVITELYIWMISVRAMAEGEQGEVLRNAIIEALWIDVAQRAKKLGAGYSSDIREQVMALSEQLQATLISYDEGLQSDDIVMAGAIWRRFYQMQDVHVDDLEKLVKYIRMQVASLDRIPLEQILKEKKVKWLPIVEQK